MMYVCDRWIYSGLVIELAVERQTNGLEKYTRILVAGCVCLDGNVATGDHLGGIAKI
jgi:hypothetical protein